MHRSTRPALAGPDTGPGGPATARPTPEKQQMYEQFAGVVKAFASPLRLMILDLLDQTERSVEALATVAGASTANTSAQLQVLADAGLVRRRRDGNRMLYRLADSEVGGLVTALMAVAEHRSASAREAAARYLGDTDQLRTITAAELETGLADGSILLLDVRPFDEYAAGHIGGARHVDATRLAESVQELLPTLDAQPTTAQIVAYCRGPYCAFAPQALRALSRHGHSGALLPDGTSGWARSGRPVDQLSPAPTR